jgi:predicted nuclease of restriction endonuclease-like (RecB) superfamily
MTLPAKDSLFKNIKALLHNARSQVIKTINSAMVNTYFELGCLIVENEQKGNVKAEYGEAILDQLSSQLTIEFGKGFSTTNLKQMRTFYLVYGKGQTLSDELEKQQTLSVKSQKTQTPSTQLAKSETVSRKFTLSWSHYVFLMRLDTSERNFYEIEATQNNWSLRELKRQFNTALFDRLRLSKDKDGGKALNKKGQIITQPHDAVKDPYILEFLGFKEDKSYSESELEQAIIDKIEHFLLELGKGFTFVGRQQRFTFDEEHFFVDLVFYNRLLKCFVLIDLKIGKLTHQDLGQIQMYVNYYDRFVKTKGENPTIGIVLCKNKKSSLVEITLPKDNKQIFASQYKTYLPTKEEFQAQIEDVEVEKNKDKNR